MHSMKWLAYMNYLIVFNDHPLSCVSFKDHIFYVVLNNFEIIASKLQWSQLAFLEAFDIKNFKPTITEGLKASRELDLFL